MDAVPVSEPTRHLVDVLAAAGVSPDSAAGRRAATSTITAVRLSAFIHDMNMTVDEACDYWDAGVDPWSASEFAWHLGRLPSPEETGRLVEAGVTGRAAAMLSAWGFANEQMAAVTEFFQLNDWSWTYSEEHWERSQRALREALDAWQVTVGQIVDSAATSASWREFAAAGKVTGLPYADVITRMRLADRYDAMYVPALCFSGGAPDAFISEELDPCPWWTEFRDCERLLRGTVGDSISAAILAVHPCPVKTAVACQDPAAASRIRTMADVSRAVLTLETTSFPAEDGAALFDFLNLST